MFYKFPAIYTIDDVLPHVKDREEFIVAERDFGTVINYMVSMPDTFNMTGPDDLGGAIRRECRGIIFDKSGNIISRPFHKFFNLGERDETQPHVIDISVPHTVMEKMDGSMIRPLIHEGRLRLGTKMGLTDVAKQAEFWLARQDKSKIQWLEYMATFATPLFEWVSPYNQIVLNYEKEDLVLLALRTNVLGVYIDIESLDAPFTLVPKYGNVSGNLNDYIALKRQDKDREGDIIQFWNGHMLKSKNDWYVNLHRILDEVRFERHVIRKILDEELDDVLPRLPPIEANRIRDLEIRFWESMGVKERYIHGRADEMKMHYGDNRKAIATEYIPLLEDRRVASMLFRILDGHNIREMLIEHVHKNISSNTKWEECAKWLEM